MAGFIIYTIYIYPHDTPHYIPLIPCPKSARHVHVKLHGCPFYQAGITSLWGSDLSLLQRLWYFAPRKAEQLSNRSRGKPGKMSTYLNMNIIWLEKKHLYIHELRFNTELSQKMPAVTCTNAWKKSVCMLATWLLLMSRVDKSNLTCSLTAWTHLPEIMTAIFSV